MASTHVEQASSSLAAGLIDERARGDHDIEATPEIEVEHIRADRLSAGDMGEHLVAVIDGDDCVAESDHLLVA